MTTGMIIINIIKWILIIAGIIGIAGMIPFSVVGIVLLVKNYNAKNDSQGGEIVKKSPVKGIIFLVLPWFLVIVSLIFLVVVKAIGKFFGIE